MAKDSAGYYNRDCQRECQGESRTGPQYIGFQSGYSVIFGKRQRIFVLIHSVCTVIVVREIIVHVDTGSKDIKSDVHRLS